MAEAGEVLELLKQLTSGNSDRYELMADPDGTTDIMLIVMGQYGSGPSAYATLEYPDGSEEDVLARGRDRLLAKVWKSKLHTWAAETGVRTGLAFLGSILCGPHRGGEFRGLSNKPSRVFGRHASSRLAREIDGRFRPDIAKLRAFYEEGDASAQQTIGALEAALEECVTAGDKAGQLQVQEANAEVRARQAAAREAMAETEAAVARFHEARVRLLRARRLPG